jgi:multicomponent Na+:H+ antiporter subunit G
MNGAMIFSGVLAVAGAFFIAVAGLGAFRFKDLYMRMHASTKASSLGLGLLLAAVAISHPEPRVLVESVLIVAFIFLTAPVAAHMISRAGYLHNSKLWEKTKIDELAGKYSRDHKYLR